jgi:hypothetical protein
VILCFFAKSGGTGEQPERRTIIVAAHINDRFIELFLFSKNG